MIDGKTREKNSFFFYCPLSPITHSPKDPDTMVTIGDGVKVEAERVVVEAERTFVKVSTPVEITEV